jgi:hypothetical protein
MKRALQLLGAAMLLHPCVGADFPVSQLSIHDLAQQADVIVVATVQNVIVQGAIFKTQLQVTQSIKGQLSSGRAFVDVIASTTMAINSAVPADVQGRAGLWFLKHNNGSWQVLPLFNGDYVSWKQYSLPLPTAAMLSPSSLLPELAAPGNSVDQFVLAALLSSYESLPNPGNLEDSYVLDLAKWKRADALAVISALTKSPKKDLKAVGLAAAIRLGSDDALGILAQQAASLQSSPKFFEVSDALNKFYQPNGESSIAPLAALIAARLNVPGLDLAAGTALQRIRTKAVLPAMALLLDSPDPDAQLRAITFFIQFTVFAQADGSLPAYGPTGPFWTPDTKAHQPGRNSPFKTPELVSFWKSWWATNKAQLGF